MPAVDPSSADPLEIASGDQVLNQPPSDVTDKEFCEAFESLKIPKQAFHHREHIRLAWIYASHFAEQEAVVRMAQGIRAFAKHHGVEAKYHHTITLAWMRLVANAVRATPRTQHFISFANANPHLLNPRLLGSYYSPQLLAADSARNGWIEPDLHPLP